MAKDVCKCGFVFRFDGNAEDYEQCLLSMKFIFDMENDIEERGITSDEFSDRCVTNWRNVHPCPECGRIYIETKPGSDQFKSYVREDLES